MTSAGQTIGAVTNASVVQLTSTSSDGRTRSNNIILAVVDGRVLIYNGSSASPNYSPNISGWSVLFDLHFNASAQTVFTFDSTYLFTMATGAVLSDRVRYTTVVRYLGQEAVSAFSTPSIQCSKYQLTFEYFAKVDTGSVTLLNEVIDQSTSTIWFADGIGFVRAEARASASFVTGSYFGLNFSFWGYPQELEDLQVYQTATEHRSGAVQYSNSFFGPSFWVAGAGTLTYGGSSTVSGSVKNF